MIGSTLYRVYRALNGCLTVVQYVVFAYCLFSWFVRPGNRFFGVLRMLAEPLLAPFRGVGRWLNARGLPFDAAPLLAFAAIALLRRVLYAVLVRLF